MLCCVLPVRECICSGLHLSCSLLLCECPCVVSRVSCVVGGRLLFLNGCWPTFYHVVLANCNINKRHSGPDTPSSRQPRRVDRTHIFVLMLSIVSHFLKDVSYALQRQHLFDQKYNKSSNIMKSYYNLSNSFLF